MTNAELRATMQTPSAGHHALTSSKNLSISTYLTGSREHYSMSNYTQLL